ncbi:MAG: hypothetical protein Q7S35_09730 [Candidatus Limnocylindrales bacterium]|nr:hypothetical protein [Candidatus Limnocylindrales bacterium]
MTAVPISGAPGPAQPHANAVALQPIQFLEPDIGAEPDPGLVILTCANCGAAMDERKCKLICRCGYFLSCSDYY